MPTAVIEKFSVLVVIFSTLVLAFPASAELSVSRQKMLKDVERQLMAWGKAGRYDDVKVISTHRKSLLKQLKSGRLNLQKIVDTHNYDHKDGKFYGRKRPRKASRAMRQKTKGKARNYRAIQRKYDQIPEANKPVMAFLRVEYVPYGFPSMLMVETEMDVYFRNGNTVGCSNWDPTTLDPTPESVGKTIKGCKVNRGKPKGKALKRFKKGETIDISFGNVSVISNDMIGSSSALMDGASLRMTKDGRIAIGRYHTITVASDVVGAQAGSKSKAIKGRYVLDGHIITIKSDSGEVIYGFIGASSKKGSDEIRHIYVNGEHFWDRENI